MPIQPTQEAQDDFRTLLNELMPQAEQILTTHREFLPFAAAITTAGEVSARAHPAGGECPSPEDVLADLLQALRGEARSGTIRATGVCYDGWIVQDRKKVGAVIVNLEHVCGSASKACITCTRDAQGGCELGGVSVIIDDPKIFALA